MSDNLKNKVCNWLFARADIPLLVADAEGTVVLSNAGAQALFGYSEKEFEGLKVEALMPERHAHRHRQNRAEFSLAPRKLTLEGKQALNARRKDGSEFVAEISLSPLENGLVLAIIEDMTERLRFEETLSEQEVQYRAIIETAADGFWIVGSDGRILAINDAYARRSGYSRAELLAMRVADLEAAESDNEVRAHIAKILANGSDHFETWHRTKSGEVWPVEIYVSYWAGAGDRLFVFARDISERKEAERSLRESERRYRELVQNANSAIIRWSRDGTITFFNEYAQSFFGWPADEAVGQNIGILVPERESTGADLSRLAQDIVDHPERYVNNINENVCRDGRRVWMTWSNHAILDEHGQVSEVLAVGSDITERKRAESALKALQEEMEQLTRFQVASQTVAAIAHELNQPLSAVASYAEAALRLLRAGNPQPEKLVHALEGSAAQAQRAGRVLGELFAFMRKGEIQTEPLDINEVVQSALNRIDMDGYGGFQSQLELHPNLSQVSANRLQLEKVLQNLIRNGLEAMHEAGIDTRSIHVRVRTSSDGGMAQVTVQDSGPGIDDQTLHRIFDPFFTTKPKGLGMGLAVSRAIIESHGGQLWVESEPGAGASFHFTLPFAS